jgi:thiamine pyrophosphate-dependent acetolactate synthase large subunit-like protein
MSAISGGELLARCLANEGIEFVFGLLSTEIDPFLAQRGAHDIRLVPVRHEAAGPLTAAESSPSLSHRRLNRAASLR